LLRHGDFVRMYMTGRMFIELGPVGLTIVLQRIKALDAPELPAEIRAALQQFLQAAARLFD